MQPDYVIQLAGNGKDWVDIMTALLTPTIAIVGAVLGFMQWRINNLRLRHEIFDKRWKLFKAASDYLSESIGIVRHAFVENTPLPAMYRSRSDIDGAKFVFNDDVASFIMKFNPLDLNREVEMSDKSDNMEALVDIMMNKRGQLEQKMAPFMRLG